MSQDERIKILIIGPSQSGKSNIANFLSGTRETPTSTYKETRPLRIFEVFLEGLSIGGQRRPGRGSRATVELWDVGGNTKFQTCWPAIAKDAHGIIFVFNPAVKNQEKELELWYKSFAVPAQVQDEHCLIFAHRSQPSDDSNASIPKVGGSLARIPRTLETSLDFHPESFKEAFDRLIEKIMAYRREQEENRVLRDESMSGPLLVGVSQ